MTEPPSGSTGPQATIGGYTVLRRLGAGGMGEVCTSSTIRAYRGTMR
ncbi:hypothetical protein [Tsukamurella spumae]|uniref:Uncharacterized protein n=1 Tax=Tsukamurella spumae TaxID=44753 RepID=A0A846WVC6_9ACTN|nr:hypothetical protein [Tsukamurella spumae]NKY16824.1 hypothetical protein [Tsukamurella spumae]